MGLNLTDLDNDVDDSAVVSAMNMVTSGAVNFRVLDRNGVGSNRHQYSRRLFVKLIDRCSVQSCLWTFRRVASQTLLCLLALMFFSEVSLAQIPSGPHHSKGCTIAALGENEAAYICKDYEISVNSVSDILVFVLKKPGTSIEHKFILEPKDIDQSYVDKFWSSLWVLDNCEPLQPCVHSISKPHNAEQKCADHFQMYTVFWGFSPVNKELLKSGEAGTTLICISDGNLYADWSVELFAVGQNPFFLMPDQLGK
jgi:hypothetical protein